MLLSKYLSKVDLPELAGPNIKMLTSDFFELELLEVNV